MSPSVSSFAGFRSFVSNKYATNWWKALRSPKPTPPHPPLCLSAFVLRGGAGQSSTPQFPSFVRAWNTNMISWGNKRGQTSKQLTYQAIVYFIGIQYGVVPSYGGITPFVSSKWWKVIIWWRSIIWCNPIIFAKWWKVTIWWRSTITFDEIAPEMACRPVRVQTGE